MTTYITEQSERATAAALEAMGYIKNGAAYHFGFMHGPQWLVVCGHPGYTFSEWDTSTSSWRKLATFHDGDMLTTVLEAVGACDRCAT